MPHLRNISFRHHPLLGGETKRTREVPSTRSWHQLLDWIFAMLAASLERSIEGVRGLPRRRLEWSGPKKGDYEAISGIPTFGQACRTAPYSDRAKNGL